MGIIIHQDRLVFKHVTEHFKLLQRSSKWKEILCTWLRLGMECLGSGTAKMNGAMKEEGKENQEPPLNLPNIIEIPLS